MWPFGTKGNSSHYLSAWLTAWVNFFEPYLNVPTSHIYCTHCMTHCVGWPFCTKGNGCHHPYLVHSLHPLHSLCPLHSLHPLHGLTFFTLKVMVATTHICWVHCVSWPFCTNTYCVHCIHCIHCMGWPFCTKGNGHHHPYLLSTLCELTFLHQHLLRPLCPLCSLHDHCVHCIHCVHCVITASTAFTVSTAWVDLFALKVTVPTTQIFVGYTVWVDLLHQHLLCSLHGGWPFCTKGNGSHHPYLLSTLHELTFLHQHLMCPLHRGLTFLQ